MSNKFNNKQNRLSRKNNWMFFKDQIIACLETLKDNF